jgi:hypothetical protein
MVVVASMGWWLDRRLRHRVLRLTEWGIYVGADDGRWDGVRRQNVAWIDVTDVRIVETRWSRQIQVTADHPVRLSFPQSNRITPVRDLDAIAEAIALHCWLQRPPTPAAAAPIDGPEPGSSAG